MSTPPIVFPSIRRAQPADAAALTELVNRAFLVETSFLEGARTDVEEILAHMRTGAFLVLERVGDRPSLAAAIYVEAREEGGYFGMLSVAPDMQGFGLGTRLVHLAEAMCEAVGAPTVRLRIINLREELGRWYRSLGYETVGTSSCAELEQRAKRPCHFVEMQRSIAGPHLPVQSAGPARAAG